MTYATAYPQYPDAPIQNRAKAYKAMFGAKICITRPIKVSIIHDASKGYRPNLRRNYTCTCNDSIAIEIDLCCAYQLIVI